MPLTGRFINTLHKNVLAYFQTDKCETLLSKENFKTVWNLTQSGHHYFIEDLAITNTIITPEFDESGRMILSNDTAIVKFTQDDLPLILEILNDHLNVLGKLRVIQGNGVELTNPLPNPEV